MDLDDGMSSWVTGYVKYYAKYSQWVCRVSDLDKAFAASDEHLGLYQCSQYCEYQASKNAYSDSFFIWIETNKCFCLHDQYVRYSFTCKHKDVVLQRNPLSSDSFSEFQCFYLLRSPGGGTVMNASK